MDPGALERQRVFDALLAEAGVLKRRHQRKGVEYRVREGGVLPPPPPHRAQSAPSPTLAEGSKLSADSGGGGGGGGGGAGAAAAIAKLDAYDPEAAKAAEHDNLLRVVTTAREQASTLHHTIMRLLAQREDLVNEREKILYEDNVMREREDGKRAVAAAKAEVTELTAALDEEDAYRDTLDYMYRRNRDQRVETLALQKAFESSLMAHTREFDLKQGLLEEVRKSKDGEVAALRALQEDIAKSMLEMDKKIEMVRGEVRLHAEKVRLRSAKAAKDRLLADVPAMSAEDGEALLVHVKELSDDATERRTERARVQAEADAAEAEYIKLKIVSGVSTGAAGEALRAATAGVAPAARTGAGDATATTALGSTMASAFESDDDLPSRSDTYAEPEPEAVVGRITELRYDTHMIESQCEDYAARLRALKHRHALLLAAKQPKARDAKDEADSDLTRMDALTRRQEASKRALEVARAEGHEAEALKIQLQQSISILAQRLGTIPTPPASVSDAPTAQEKDDAAATRSLLDRDAAALPSEWARGVHTQVRAVVDAIHGLHRVVNVPESTRAFHEARQWLEQDLRTERRSVRVIGRSSSLSETPVAGGRRAGGSPDGSVDAESSLDVTLARMVMDKEDELEATIEQLVADSQYGVRVTAASETIGRTGVVATIAAAAIPLRPTKMLSDAAHAFERHLRDGVGKALREEAAATGGGSTSGATSRGSGRGAAGAAGGAGGDDHGHGEATPFGQRGSLAAQVTATLKPKTRELHKMLASALQMTGVEVGEYLTSASKGDSDEVVTREQLKRATHTQIRQVMRSIRASRAAAAAAAAADSHGHKPAARASSVGSSGAGGL